MIPLDELLEQSGTHRDEVYITNVLRCHATETGKPGDRIRPASKDEQDACRVWTDLEI